MNIDIKALENAGLTTEQIAAILMNNKQKADTKTAEAVKPIDSKIVDITNVTNATNATKGHDEPQEIEMEIFNEEDITSIEDLEKYAKGVILRFPDFSDGQPFIAKVKRPCLLAMVKSGRIPNQLLKTAEELFQGKVNTASKKGDGEGLKNLMEICEIFAEASLVQPTYQQIKDAGIELTDTQLMAFFNYSQAGAKALKRFHKK